jgi:hypothetical protein
MNNKYKILVVLIILFFVACLIIVLKGNNSTNIDLVSDNVVRSTLLGLRTDNMDNNSFIIGSQKLIELFVDTAGENIVGLDAVINYSSEKIKIISIEQGNNFQFYPLKKIEKDKISISALKEPSTSISGNLKVADILIECLQEGEASMKFNFKAGSTIDSNIVKLNSANDILGNVENLTFEIKISN